MKMEQMEQAKINEVAHDYTNRGYSVRVHPSSAELPPFLRSFQPDIIAISPQGNIVIEVKASSSVDAELVKQLAQEVERQPGWRFEIVFVGPPVAPDVPAEEDLAPEEQVSRLLSSAERLFADGQLEAAAMVAWSAAETILRRRAQSYAPEMERQSSARVLKHLYSLGRVNPGTYEKLLRLMEFRNAVAHGFQPRVVPPNISDIVPDIRHLQHAA
jgi:hypothetical protein